MKYKIKITSGEASVVDKTKNKALFISPNFLSLKLHVNCFFWGKTSFQQYNNLDFVFQEIEDHDVEKILYSLVFALSFK